MKKGFIEIQRELMNLQAWFVDFQTKYYSQLQKLNTMIVDLQNEEMKKLADPAVFNTPTATGSEMVDSQKAWAKEHVKLQVPGSAELSKMTPAFVSGQEFEKGLNDQGFVRTQQTGQFTYADWAQSQEDRRNTLDPQSSKDQHPFGNPATLPNDWDKKVEPIIAAKPPEHFPDTNTNMFMGLEESVKRFKDFRALEESVKRFEDFISADFIPWLNVTGLNLCISSRNELIGGQCLAQLPAIFRTFTCVEKYNLLARIDSLLRVSSTFSRLVFNSKEFFGNNAFLLKWAEQQRSSQNFDKFNAFYKELSGLNEGYMKMFPQFSIKEEGQENLFKDLEDLVKSYPATNGVLTSETFSLSILKLLTSDETTRQPLRSLKFTERLGAWATLAIPSPKDFEILFGAALKS